MIANSKSITAIVGQFLLIFLLLLTGSFAYSVQEHRVALVIGNSNYKTSPLKNPVNDARSMAGALRDLGFDVLVGENMSRKGMLQSLRGFRDKLKPDSIGLFYYAGHGVQVKGQNFLIPIDASVQSEAEMDEESINLTYLLDRLEEAKNPINIVILDACRDNPFARSFRSASRGLAQVDAPTGTMIAYATAPGRTAADGNGSNGTYTEEMLRVLKYPGLKVEDVLKRVRAGVVQSTNGAQTPWDASSLIGDFYFIPPAQPREIQNIAVQEAPKDTNPADGVWSMFMQCTGPSAWSHSLLGRLVTNGKMIGTTAAHNSPERWDFTFNMPNPRTVTVSGTMVDVNGKSGNYEATAIADESGKNSAFKGVGNFNSKQCAFEARQLK
jgi:hypothetical protein